jgi:hypothetical protein
MFTVRLQLAFSHMIDDMRCTDQHTAQVGSIIRASSLIVNVETIESNL